MAKAGGAGASGRRRAFIDSRISELLGNGNVTLLKKTIGSSGQTTVRYSVGGSTFQVKFSSSGAQGPIQKVSK